MNLNIYSFMCLIISYVGIYPVRSLKNHCDNTVVSYNLRRLVSVLCSQSNKVAHSRTIGDEPCQALLCAQGFEFVESGLSLSIHKHLSPLAQL